MAGPYVVRQTSTAAPAAPLLGATCPGGSRLQEFLGPVAPGGRSRCAGRMAGGTAAARDDRSRCCEQQEPLRLAGRAAAQGRQEPLRWAAAGAVVVGGRSHAGGRSCRSHTLVSASCVLHRVRVATRGGAQ